MNKDKAQETKVIEPKGVVDGGVPYVPETPPANPAANPVVVETYEDFQCPGCAAFELNTNTPSGVSNGDWLRAQADTGRISLRFKPYSFLDGASTNAYSSRAMNVAMCLSSTKSGQRSS